MKHKLIRHNFTGSGPCQVVAHSTGEFVRYIDLVNLKTALLEKLEETYKDIYDDDSYTTGKVDMIFAVESVLRDIKL